MDAEKEKLQKSQLTEKAKVVDGAGQNLQKKSFYRLGNTRSLETVVTSTYSEKSGESHAKESEIREKMDRSIMVASYQDSTCLLSSHSCISHVCMHRSSLFSEHSEAFLLRFRLNLIRMAISTFLPDSCSLLFFFHVKVVLM